MRGQPVAPWSPHTGGDFSEGAKFTVRFVRPWQNFFPGDVAGFAPHVARNLVARRLAERVNVEVLYTGALPADAIWALRYPVPPVTKGS